MTAVKTPCIGICSTTSVGDRVCRGCKRYAFEVVRWNGYDAAAKEAVLRRVEMLVCQILQNKVKIFSVPALRKGVERAGVPYDPSLSPYCWLHNLLKKHHARIGDLKRYGCCALPAFEGLGVAELSGKIEEELLALCAAHYDRYLARTAAPGPRRG